MDAFFADILSDAKVTSKNATSTIHKNVMDDFKSREKFYSGLIKKKTNVCINDVIEIHNKEKKRFEKTKYNNLKTNLHFKSDKSSQGQNLSFSQLCQLAKSNKKTSNTHVEKISPKKDIGNEKHYVNTISSINKPKIPKLIIRKTDYTIKKKEPDVHKNKEQSKKTELDKIFAKSISSEKEIPSKNKNKHISIGTKRKIENDKLSSKSTTKIRKVSHKSFDKTYNENKKISKKKRYLKNYNEDFFDDTDNSMDDFIDDDNDDLPSRTEFEEALRSISRYDKNRWKKNEHSIKENEMISSFSDITKEEKKSLKLALKEDLKEKIKGSRSL